MTIFKAGDRLVYTGTSKSFKHNKVYEVTPHSSPWSDYVVPVVVTEEGVRTNPNKWMGFQLYMKRIVKNKALEE